MLFWWLTLTFTFKPLTSLVTRLLLTATLFMKTKHHHDKSIKSNLPNYKTENNNNAYEISTEKSGVFGVSSPNPEFFSPAKVQDFFARNQFFTEDEAEFYGNWTTSTTFRPTSATDPSSEMSIFDSSKIPGVYEYQSAVNFNAYLKELGVSSILRTLAGLATPVVTVSRINDCQQDTQINNCQNGSDYWRIRTDTLFRSHEVRFALGVEGTDTTMDGRTVKYVIRQSGDNEWTEEQTPKSGGQTTTIIRRFTPDKMNVILEINGVKASSIFNRG